VVLTSGDRLIANGDGVGPSLGLLPSWAAKQSKHEAPVSANSVYDGYTSSDDITVWMVDRHSCPKTTLHISNMKRFLGAAKLSTSSSTHSLSALDEPQARR